MSNKILRTFCAAWLGLAYAACGTTEQTSAEDSLGVTEKQDGSDIQQALSALNGASVMATQEDGVTPSFIKGNFGQVAAGLRAADVQPALRNVAPVFRMRAEDLVLKRTSQDSDGHTYFRYSQTKNGLPVVGAELILMVDRAGTVYAANSSAYDVAQGVQVSTRPTLASEAAAVAAKGSDVGFKSESTGRLVYVRGENGRLVLAHETLVTGERDGLPVVDMVYVNANNGHIALRAPTIHSALNRAVYTANNGTSTPGTLKRSEGGAATGDTHVDDNYTHLGTTYRCYSENFQRDSYNAAGAQLKSTVHYGSNYVNAYWDGTQMVYGDGDGTQSGPLGKSLDVTVHELTHAVTDSESDLVYSNESGALNEGMSDIFSAYCESWTKGWAMDAPIWMIGDDIWTPATPNDALRYMANPTQDGSSKDYYPERYTGTSDNGGVHWNSGIANLAFKLLSTGGTHPRGKTTTNVTGIGVQKAGKIFYEANANCLTSSSNFAHAKTCTEQKAEQFYGVGSAEKLSTTAAWEAVGVGIVVPPPPAVTLSNGVAVTNISDSSGNKRYYKLTVPTGQSSLKFNTSGGTGDLDMYVRRGAAPDSTTYDCRPYASGNTEECAFTNPVAGDYYVMLSAYSTYSGAQLVGTYTAAPPPGNVLTNGVATAAYSSTTTATWKCWTLAVPAGKTSVVFNQAGGTGDADLYVKLGSAPTLSSYNCRPYLSGNTETCTISAPAAGTYYACSYAYTTYANVTMKGTY